MRPKTKMKTYRKSVQNKLKNKTEMNFFSTCIHVKKFQDFLKIHKKEKQFIIIKVVFTRTTDHRFTK